MLGGSHHLNCRAQVADAGGVNLLEGDFVNETVEVYSAVSARVAVGGQRVIGA